MKKYKREDYSLEIFKGILFFLPMIFGLFYEFSAFLSGCILTLFLIYITYTKGKLKVGINLNIICVGVISFSYLLTVLFGIDKGMSFIGFLRIIPLMLFVVTLMQFSYEDKEKIINVIPKSAGVMVLVSGFSFFIKSLKDYFYMANRLGGFFQYPNTFALYLLIGIIILGYKSEYKKEDYINFTILFIGILLTGSRSIFIFTIVTLGILILRVKELRKKLLIGTYSIIIIGGGIAIITNNYQNVGIFLTISLNSSTLLGRLLYYKDGLKLLIQNPFGLGYMGYYYIQPQVQTGVYTTKFIHNDFIQIALDCGLVALIAILVLIASGIISKKISKRNKSIILVIALSSLLEFNFQFLIIFFVLLLCLDRGGLRIKEYSKKKNIKLINSLLSILAIVFIYFFFVFFAEYNDEDKVALEMYKWNTLSKVKVMMKETDMYEAEKMAANILSQNKYISEAYNIKALSSASKREYYDMVEYKKQAIKNNKYLIEEYDGYVELLRIAINHYSSIGQKENKDNFITYLKEIHNMLIELEDGTSNLAFKINDKPTFKLSKINQDYIKLMCR